MNDLPLKAILSEEIVEEMYEALQSAAGYLDGMMRYPTAEDMPEALAHAKLMIVRVRRARAAAHHAEYVEPHLLRYDNQAEAER